MRFLTAGESHGKALTVIIEGLPANLTITAQDINRELLKRQQGYGRGGRMKIEHDTAEIISGVRNGKTLGSPVTLMIRNKDWQNWTDRMGIEPGSADVPPVTAVRPGHADLPGMIKYGQKDLRNILERSSARETAARVAAGAIAKAYLKNFNIAIWSHVVRIGSIKIDPAQYASLNAQQAEKALEETDLRCLSPEAEKEMKHYIDAATANGVTVGGVFEVIAENVPPGIGSHVHWDRRIDGLFAQAVMSIQGVKGVEIGIGFGCASLTGENVHDEIIGTEAGSAVRATNRAGGIEGGITNGEKVILRAAMKPIPTMRKPLRSIDALSKKPIDAHFERSDNCAVPAAGIVGESMVALVLAEHIQQKLGGDYLEEQLERWRMLHR